MIAYLSYIGQLPIGTVGGLLLFIGIILFLGLFIGIASYITDKKKVDK